MGRIAKRTDSGNVTSEARERYGDSQGKFPIFDQRSAMSAIKLRGHSDNPNGVLERASRWASANNNSAVANMVERARERS